MPAEFVFVRVKIFVPVLRIATSAPTTICALGIGHYASDSRSFALTGTEEGEKQNTCTRSAGTLVFTLDIGYLRDAKQRSQLIANGALIWEKPSRNNGRFRTQRRIVSARFRCSGCSLFAAHGVSRFFLMLLPYVFAVRPAHQQPA